MNNKNQQSKEFFLSEITHPRKRELAQMILNNSSVEEMRAAEFGRIQILEMVRKINSNVEGMEEFDLEVPRQEGDADFVSEVAASAEKKSGSPIMNTSDNASQESASLTPGAQKSSESEIKPEEKKLNADGQEIIGDGGAHKTETLGGHEVTAKTGEEDAETLAKREADAKAAADAATI